MRIIAPYYLEILRPAHVRAELVLALETGGTVILATMEGGEVVAVTHRGEATPAQREEIQNLIIKLHESPEAFLPDGELAHLVRQNSEGPTE